MKFDAVLFYCGGVLVDSEPITNGVLRDMLEEMGWTLGPQESMQIFVGKAVKDEATLIEARTSQPLSEGWLVRFRERRNVGLITGVKPTSGAVVEDSVTGVIAGVAAGATVFGYSPAEAGHDAPAALRGAGAIGVFVDRVELPRLIVG